MPRKERSIVEERMRFVLRLKDGEEAWPRCARLYRSGGKDPAALKQPFWTKSVKDVFGTFCKGCLRTVQLSNGGEGGIRTHGTVSRTLAFEASTFNRSVTSPRSVQSFYQRRCRPRYAAFHRVHKNPRTTKPYASYRRAAKKLCSSEAASSASTPGVTSTW